jgi:alanyl-tRNA synthetase
MTSREIRSSFLDYFRRQGHTIVPSSSLVPGDDPTLLFTNAGMNQFKDTFLGREKRAYRRATTSQKCMRVSGKHNDLDNVGPSLRHHTFFEMLGNFSFGDYFKTDAIPFAWELLTTVWKLSPDRLFPTIFKGDAGIPRDDAAHAIWTKLVPADRITELGLAENFWAMGDTGPCGRCSEIHYFRGNHVPCDEERRGGTCLGIDCSCDRFVEVWNNVFMEFERQADGTLSPLPAPSIDTGMGLERITAVIQGKLANYDTDLFTPILTAIGARAGRQYGASLNEPADVSMRVIADHLRAMTFLIADGVVPSNEWRGYVLRKIMRRAMRHGKKLGFAEPVLHTFVDVIVNEMGEAYPELRANRDVIVHRVKSEEERFETVLTSGLPRLEEALDRAATGNRVLPGDEAFRLYDSLGVPLDFMEDLAEQRQLTVDRQGFDRAMEGQREKARAGSTFKGGDKALTLTLSPELEKTLDQTGDQFAGYDTTVVQGTPIVALFDESGASIESVSAGSKAYVALARTPFYIESGGQVSDAGTLLGTDGSAAVVERLVRPRPSRPRLHLVRVDSGSLRQGQIVTAEVTDDVRDATRRNHTATHLLHAALRTVLGPHVKQAGSLVAPDRLRFDFVHSSAMTAEELQQVERIVNDQILRNSAVATEVKTPEEAIAQGAMALFGEKYGDRVRVVSIPGFSMELCGGTHVRATGDIGLFAITEESGVAAGVRRIEAVTGAGAVRWAQAQREALDSLVVALNTTPAQGVETVQKLLAENKRLAREVEQLKMKVALGGGSAARQDAAQDVDGVKLVTQRVEGLEKGALRGLADSLRDRLGSGVVIITSQNDDKVALVVSVSKDLTTRVQAGRLVKELAPIVGGGGGGRPDFAEAGGKNPAKIEELLETAPAVLKALLASGR